MKAALMSFLGSRLGHLSKASPAASTKSSLPNSPSLFPNFDKPADTMETNGFPINYFASN